MPSLRALLLLRAYPLFGLMAAAPACADEVGSGAFGLGLDIGMAFVILLAVLIGISVLSKLAIVFGLVPRQPETSGQALVHAMANFVGGLTRPRSRRRDHLPSDDR